MTERWPDGRLPYHLPGPDPAERERWQRGIQAVPLRPDGSHNHYLWDGRCPRCGHAFTCVVQFDVLGVVSVEERVERQEQQVACACDQGDLHGRDGQGCGAGRGVPVKLTRPRAGGLGDG